MEAMTSPTYSDVSPTSTVQALKLIWLVVEPYPSEKYKSELGLSFPIYGKIKHVPNHQLVICVFLVLSTNLMIFDIRISRLRAMGKPKKRLS